MARDRRDRDDDLDDYDDAPRSSPGPAGPLDGMFAKTNIVVLILFGCCCGVIAFALSLVAYLTAKDPKAKSNALIVLIISGIFTALGVIGSLTGNLAQLTGGGGR